MSGRSFELAPGPATFGRGLQNNYIIPDDSVSTEHLLVMSGPGQCRIKDRNTSNGTFVNGERVTQAALKHGDELKIGEVLVSVEMEVREAPRPGGAMKQAKKRALPDVNMAELAAAVRAGRPGAKAKQTQNAAAKKRAASGPTFDEVASDYVPEVRRKRIILPFGSILVWGCLVSLMVAGVWQFFFSKKVEVVVAPPPVKPAVYVAPEKPSLPVELVGFVQQEGPPEPATDIPRGPGLPTLQGGFLRLVTEAGTAQAAVDAAQPGDAVVFDAQELQPVVIDKPLTNVQFIGGGAEWTINADLVDCQFFWHTPVSFRQKSGRLERCAFYRSHSPDLEVNAADAVSFYYGGERVEPASFTSAAQMRFTGMARGVMIHRPVVATAQAEPRWDMKWPPVFEFDCLGTNAPGDHSYILGGLSLGQTAWTPFRIVRGVGITFAQGCTEGNVWADPLVDIDNGIDCVLLSTAFGGNAAAAGYLRQPDKLTYAGRIEYGHATEYAPFRGAAARVGGQRNRLIGIGGLGNWSIGRRDQLPGSHYADGIVARDPYLQEWSAETVGLTMNFAPPINVFKLDWGYRAAPEVKTSSKEKSRKYPLAGPNVLKPVFVPLQDLRSAPPSYEGSEVKDLTGRPGPEIERALGRGENVFLGEGVYQFAAPITNGVLFGAGMDRTVVEWPEKVDCATRNCRGLIGLTVKGGRYGYNSQSGAGGETNTANALILRTRFQDQEQSGINVHAFRDQVYQDCEFLGCRNGITQGRLKGSGYWWSDRGKAGGRAVVRLSVANCRFRRIKERAIELSMRQADEGVVGIHHSVFEEMPGQAILLQGGKSLLIQSCSFNDVGAAGSRTPVVQVSVPGSVVLSHLDFLNIAGMGAATALSVDGLPVISHCTFGGFDQAIVSRNPVVLDHCVSEDAPLDLPFSSLIFKSAFSNADVSKGVMTVITVDRFESVSLEASVQPLDVTPPPAVKATVTVAADGNAVTWPAVDDPESGIVRYHVYANGRLVGMTPLTISAADYRDNPFTAPTNSLRFADPTLERREYSVRAVNGANLSDEIGQAPLAGWGPVRGEFFDRKERVLFFSDIDYDARKKRLEVTTVEREKLPSAQLQAGGAPQLYKVEDGPLRRGTGAGLGDK